jgi:hypothetical protein
VQARPASNIKCFCREPNDTKITLQIAYCSLLHVHAHPLPPPPHHTHAHSEGRPFFHA